jgi:hypothetical protein
MADVPGHAISGAVNTFTQTMSLTCECDEFTATRSIAELGIIAAMQELADAGLAHIVAVEREHHSEV